MNIKTVVLTGAETAVSISGDNAEIRNNGAETAYAAAAAGIAAGADGVVSIPAGTSVTVTGTHGAVHIKGSGSFEVFGKDYISPVFKSAAAAGGAGEDTVARQAIGTHAGNGEIHVSAAEKAAWSAKAELSDIPAALPANGGNADTVNGKTVQISSYRGFSSLGVSGADEADAVWRAIPPDSVFAVEAQYLTSTSWNFPAGTGQYTLLIAKLSNQRLLGMFLFPKVNGSIYFANVDQNGDYTGNWRKICDGGNAATLDNHPASDFALKSELDSLAYRVAALEGGT